MNKPESWHQMLMRHHKEKLKRVEDAIAAGLTAPEAAAQQGCEPQILHGFCAANGISWPRGSVQESPRFRRRAALRAMGLSTEEIARREGISLNSMRHYFSSYGIKANHPGEGC